MGGNPGTEGEKEGLVWGGERKDRTEQGRGGAGSEEVGWEGEGGAGREEGGGGWRIRRRSVLRGGGGGEGGSGREREERGKWEGGLWGRE